MKRIKVTFVETNCKKNGPIKQTLNIIQYMDKSIFDPSLITIWPEQSDNTMLDEYNKLGIPIFCCGLTKKKSIFYGSHAVNELLEKINPDIVQAVGIPPYRMSLRYKKAIHFVTLRNYCYEDYPDQYAKGIGSVLAAMDMRLIKKQLKKGEPFITCSKSLSQLYSEKQNIDIPYIQNGVDVSLYTKRVADEITKLRKKLSLPLDKKILTYSGGLIDRKNQKEAIEGFLNSKSDNAILLLLGDGKDRDDLEGDYGKCNNIIFRGKVNNVIDYLHASDMYISTSKSEGLPNGVLEAMACGLPVLLSNIPQHMEIIETNANCGLSYQLGDVSDLSKKIILMLKMNLVDMGNHSHITVQEHFTAQGMSSKYQHVYCSMVEKNLGKGEF